MPNWCFTSYVIEGNKKDLKKIHNILSKLESMPVPAVPNGFGTNWLGCLVHALGESYEKIRCRGTFEEVEMDGDKIFLHTETAWEPCREVFDLLRRKFPSIEVYYYAEEPGMCIFVTNDVHGKYFYDRVMLTVNSRQTDYTTQYFHSEQEAFRWLEKTFDCTVRSPNDVDALAEALTKECDDWFLEFEAVSVEI